jgi:hypothetical protein
LQESSINAAQPDQAPLLPVLPDVEQLRGPTRWIGAIITAIALDLVGIVATLAAYSWFRMVELTGTPVILPASTTLRLLLFAGTTQLGAIIAARRTRQPLVLPLWALVFVAPAVFAAVMASMALGSVVTVFVP